MQAKKVLGGTPMSDTLISPFEGKGETLTKLFDSDKIYQEHSDDEDGRCFERHMHQMAKANKDGEAYQERIEKAKLLQHLHTSDIMFNRILNSMNHMYSNEERNST